MAEIESVWNCVLAAHCPCNGTIILRLFLRFFLGGDRFPCNRKLKRNDRIDGSGECDLHRSANLSAIDTCCHHGTKGANVIEILTHPRASLCRVVGFHFRFLFVSCRCRILCSLVLEIQNAFLIRCVLSLKIQFAARAFSCNYRNGVADLSFQATVGHQSLQ